MKAVVLTDTHYFFSEDSNLQNEEMLAEILATVEEPEAILHCGDIGNHELWHTQEYFRTLRNFFPTTIVGAVLGNHNFWEVNARPLHHGVQEMIDENKKIFAEFNIQYLPEQPIVGNEVFITGFNGWYHDIYVSHEKYVPHLTDPADGRVKLSRLAFEGFQRCRAEMEAAKERGLRTTLVTHFGSILKASENDWKTKMGGGYFGANPAWEDHLENCDHYFFGHSHVAYDEIAKNGHTHVLNVGSDYEFPRYKVIEI